MGFQVHVEALPHFTIVCHVRFPLRAKAASHPWGHAHMRPSRSVSNNYHATNHQPIRNTGAKKKRRATVQNGGRAADARALPRLRGIWGIRFACRMTTGQIRRRTRRCCAWRQCSARGMQTEAITLQAEVFVRECMADTKKATAYAMTQKPHRNICGTTAWLALAEGSVRSISSRNTASHRTCRTH